VEDDPVIPILLALLAVTPAAGGGGRAPALPAAPSSGGGRAPALQIAAPTQSPDLPGGPALAWEDDEDGDGDGDGDSERQPRVRITAWGGQALDDSGTGRGSTVAGGEASWAFDSLDVGVSAAGYRELEGAERTWTPVVLARLTQRFRMRSGLEAAFGFGLGAGRPTDWTGWFQVALGVRVPLGPVFLAGELAFEEGDLLRLGAGLGVALW
jgi:hypothetical protein